MFIRCFLEFKFMYMRLILLHLYTRIFWEDIQRDIIRDIITGLQETTGLTWFDDRGRLFGEGWQVLAPTGAKCGRTYTAWRGKNNSDRTNSLCTSQSTGQQRPLTCSYTLVVHLYVEVHWMQADLTSHCPSRGSHMSWVASDQGWEVKYL